MKIEGTYVFKASREVVWKALLDPRVIAGSLPGCELLTAIGENQYRGKIQTKVGPVQGQFEGTVTISDVQPPESYRLKVDVKGAPGFILGEGSIRLQEQEGATRLEYDMTAQVGGRIAAVGQRLLDSSARVITRQSLEELDKQMQSLTTQPEPGSNSPSPSPPTSAPGQTQFAARVARGVAGDLLRSNRTAVILVAIVLLALLSFVVFRACAA